MIDEYAGIDRDLMYLIGSGAVIDNDIIPRSQILTRDRLDISLVLFRDIREPDRENRPDLRAHHVYHVPAYPSDPDTIARPAGKLDIVVQRGIGEKNIVNKHICIKRLRIDDVDLIYTRYYLRFTSS